MDSTPPKITREQARDQLLELRNLDPEEGHIEADNVLLALIDDDDITRAFHGITKWYA